MIFEFIDENVFSFEFIYRIAIKIYKLKYVFKMFIEFIEENEFAPESIYPIVGKNVIFKNSI